MPRRPNKNRNPFLYNAWLVAAANVEIAEQKIAALQFAIRTPQYGHSHMRQVNRAAEDAEFSAIHVMLYRNLNDAYRDLLMFGVMLGGDEVREAKKMAYHHFLREGMAISEYMSFPFRYAPRVDHEKEFRKEILAAMECPYEHGDDTGCSAVELVRLQEQHQSRVAQLNAALEGMADLDVEEEEDDADATD